MQTRLLERFLRYVAVTSQSDASQAVVPSTEGQRSLKKRGFIFARQNIQNY